LEPYAIYGPFYDATQGPRNAANYLHLLRQHHPRARTLLEIACGTGATLVPLSKKYSVTGLDVSRTMLRIARSKLPAVKFHCQDMAGFQLKERFDAVICPYDSINHLLGFKDWVRTFKAARRHLNTDGVFIFDMNTRHKLQTLAKSATWIRQFDENYLIMKVSMSAHAVADWDVRVFERLKSGQYRLHHEVIKERSFDHEQIQSSLKSCFQTVRAFDVAGWSRPKRLSGRLFYVCR
jgi:cyclopropane fatty-acyl-phospholipid synthase-like methyltransferase